MKKRITVNKIDILKFFKKHTKQKYLKKNNFFLNISFKKKLFFSLQQNPKKTRKWLYYRLSKYRLIYNYRQLSFNTLLIENMNFMSLEFFNSLYNIQKRYSYYGFVSQDYYNFTDYHLELFRRFLRKKLGKKVFLYCKIRPYLIILKRPNQVRMGGGKGNKFSKLIYPLYPGCIFIEVRGSLFKYIKIAAKNLVKKINFNFKLINFQRV